MIDGVDAQLVLAEALKEQGLENEAATVRLDCIAKLRAKGSLAAVARLELG